MTIKAISEAVGRAIRKHRETRKHYVVCEMDEGEGRVIKVLPESYTRTDEFEAFEGVVLYTTEDEE